MCDIFLKLFVFWISGSKVSSLNTYPSTLSKYTNFDELKNTYKIEPYERLCQPPLTEWTILKEIFVRYFLIVIRICFTISEESSQNILSFLFCYRMKLWLISPCFFYWKYVSNWTKFLLKLFILCNITRKFMWSDFESSRKFILFVQYLHLPKSQRFKVTFRIILLLKEKFMILIIFFENYQILKSRGIRF